MIIIKTDEEMEEEENLMNKKDLFLTRVRRESKTT